MSKQKVNKTEPRPEQQAVVYLSEDEVIVNSLTMLLNKYKGTALEEYYAKKLNQLKSK